MTKLQRIALDALDDLGSMTRHELETACLVGKKGRGGFDTVLRSLFVNKLVAVGRLSIWITPDGIRAIEWREGKEND